MTDTSDLPEQVKSRRAKLQAIKASGKNPYRTGYAVTHAIHELRERFDGLTAEELEGVDEQFAVAGRLLTMRVMGKACFLTIRGREADLQLLAKLDLLGAESYETVKHLDLGDLLGATGKIFRTRTGELTLRAARLDLHAKCLSPLPEKFHGLSDVELRYRRRYLDLIVNPEVRRTFRQRGRMITLIRDFFERRGYYEVETPMMHAIAGGAAARPFTTHHNTLDMPLYLRIAPELFLKRLLVGGLERVYEINRNFRNEGLSTQHNPEFTMIEFYQAYATYQDLMELTEALLQELALAVCGAAEITYQGKKIDLQPPFKRLTIAAAAAGLITAEVKTGRLDWAPEVGQACLHEIFAALLEHVPEETLAAVLNDAGVAAGDAAALKPAAIWRQAENGERLIKQIFARLCGALPEHEAQDLAGHLQYLVYDRLVEHTLDQPTFVVEFPAAVSPLARRNDERPWLTDRFELVIAGRELANAFSELNDPDDQAQRFLNQARARQRGNEEAMAFDSDYIRALEYGLPPAAGEGLGIDRLVMLLTDQPSIRDVILFPLLRRETA